MATDGGERGGSDLPEMIGGRRGLVEAVTPSLAFAVGILHSLTAAVTGAVVAAAVLTSFAAVQRRNVGRPLGGLLAAGLGAAFVVLSGRGETYFIPSLVRTGVSLLVCVGSIAAGRPAVGYVITLLDPAWKGWRDDPSRRAAARNATWLWAGIFSVRLGAKLPAYFDGRTGELGVLELGLGWPLFVVGTAGTWYLVRHLRAGGGTAPGTGDGEQRRP